MKPRRRLERDTLGIRAVPADAYYGIQTQRAVENFPISGLRFPRSFLRALGLIKTAAAQVNRDLGLLDRRRAGALIRAAREVAEGKHDDQFVVDVFQTGSGTSTHMNANEVIARRAGEILRAQRDLRDIHPNDHVNLGQSSNDVFPSALHLAALEQTERKLLPALGRLRGALATKARAFDRILKIGRTHLQDATPLTLGQEFSGYARQVELAIRRVRSIRASLCELPLGGTAVGTGINTHPKFAARVIARLNRDTGLRFREAVNHFEAQGARDAVVETSGALKTVAVGLMKIANDLRWLSSGPRGGIGEIALPAVQPGSSIMPGKVNPVIPESVMQAAAQVIGHDATITLCGQAGNFELNTFMPVMAYDLLQAIALLSRAADTLARRCIRGIRANPSRCRTLAEQSLALATALAPAIGYDQAASIAAEAFRAGKTVQEIARQRRILPEGQLAALLDPWRMTRPGLLRRTSRRKHGTARKATR
ncbi:MAG: class II fumarate hydratase [Nitrospirae bacterium]|nr:class II fumarate hydratase [Nitrospirota bacterium]